MILFSSSSIISLILYLRDKFFPLFIAELWQNSHGYAYGLERMMGLCQDGREWRKCRRRIMECFFLYQCNPRTIYRELRHPIHPANTWSIGAIHRTSTPAALVTRICADLACLTEEVKQIPSNYGVSASVAENDSNPQTDTTHTPLQETPRRTTPATLAANRFRVRCTDTRSHIFFLFPSRKAYRVCRVPSTTPCASLDLRRRTLCIMPNERWCGVAQLVYGAPGRSERK